MRWVLVYVIRYAMLRFYGLFFVIGFLCFCFLSGHMVTFECAIFIPTTLGHPWGCLIHAQQLYHLRLTPTMLAALPPTPSPNHLPYPPPAADSITHSPIDLFPFIPIMHQLVYMFTTHIPTLHTHHAHHCSYSHLSYPSNPFLSLALHHSFLTHLFSILQRACSLCAWFPSILPKLFHKIHSPPKTQIPCQASPISTKLVTTFPPSIPFTSTQLATHYSCA